jgi:hypothetical protein
MAGGQKPGEQSMSTFVDIVRYDENGPDGGAVIPLERNEIEAAIRQLPTYKSVDDEEGWAVKLSGTGLFAVLDDESGILSCQLEDSSDADMVLEALRKLASKIPGAVVQDEEGETY